MANEADIADEQTVPEYRDLMTEQALQIVEMDAQFDTIGRAAHCLRLEVLRLRKILGISAN